MGGGSERRRWDVKAVPTPSAATRTTIATASACPPVAFDTTPGFPRQLSPRRSSAVGGATIGPAGDDPAGDDLRPDRAGHLAEAGVDPDELALADVRQAVPGQSLDLGMPVRDICAIPLSRWCRRTVLSSTDTLIIPRPRCARPVIRTGPPSTHPRVLSTIASPVPRELMGYLSMKYPHADEDAALREDRHRGRDARDAASCDRLRMLVPRRRCRCIPAQPPPSSDCPAGRRLGRTASGAPVRAVVPDRR